MTSLGHDTGTRVGLRAPLNLAVRSVSGMLPCYNDAATIGAVVTQLRDGLDRCGVPFEIVVVDDGSTDDSGQVLDLLRADVPELRIVRHHANRGYGAALRSGFAAARLDWVFYTDGDGQYDPAGVVDLVRVAASDVDWVQGWKVARADHWTRRVAGRAYHRLVRLLFGVGVRDTDCDFRLIRRPLLHSLRLRSASGAICAELVFKLSRAGARVVEVPVRHYERPHGRSQFFRPARVAAMAGDVARLWIGLVVLRRADA